MAFSRAKRFNYKNPDIDLSPADFNISMSLNRGCLFPKGPRFRKQKSNSDDSTDFMCPRLNGCRKNSLECSTSHKRRGHRIDSNSNIRDLDFRKSGCSQASLSRDKAEVKSADEKHFQNTVVSKSDKNNHFDFEALFDDDYGSYASSEELSECLQIFEKRLDKVSQEELGKRSEDDILRKFSEFHKNFKNIRKTANGKVGKRHTERFGIQQNREMAKIDKARSLHDTSGNSETSLSRDKAEEKAAEEKHFQDTVVSKSDKNGPVNFIDLEAFIDDDFDSYDSSEELPECLKLFEKRLVSQENLDKRSENDISRIYRELDRNFKNVRKTTNGLVAKMHTERFGIHQIREMANIDKALSLYDTSGNSETSLSRDKAEEKAAEEKHFQDTVVSKSDKNGHVNFIDLEAFIDDDFDSYDSSEELPECLKLFEKRLVSQENLDKRSENDISRIYRELDKNFKNVRKTTNGLVAKMHTERFGIHQIREMAKIDKARSLYDTSGNSETSLSRDKAEEKAAEEKHFQDTVVSKSDKNDHVNFIDSEAFIDDDFDSYDSSEELPECLKLFEKRLDEVSQEKLNKRSENDISRIFRELDKNFKNLQKTANGIVGKRNTEQIEIQNIREMVKIDKARSLYDTSGNSKTSLSREKAEEKAADEKHFQNTVVSISDKNDYFDFESLFDDDYDSYASSEELSECLQIFEKRLEKVSQAELGKRSENYILRKFGETNKNFKNIRKTANGKVGKRYTERFGIQQNREIAKIDKALSLYDTSGNSESFLSRGKAEKISADKIHFPKAVVSRSDINDHVNFIDLEESIDDGYESYASSEELSEYLKMFKKRLDKVSQEVRDKRYENDILRKVRRLEKKFQNLRKTAKRHTEEIGIQQNGEMAKIDRALSLYDTSRNSKFQNRYHDAMKEKIKKAIAKLLNDLNIIITLMRASNERKLSQMDKLNNQLGVPTLDQNISETSEEIVGEIKGIYQMNHHYFNYENCCKVLSDQLQGSKDELVALERDVRDITIKCNGAHQVLEGHASIFMKLRDEIADIQRDSRDNQLIN